MYQIIESPATLKAHATIGTETGLTRKPRGMEPVLCVGALFGIAANLAKVVTSATMEAVQSASEGSDPNATNTECTDAAFDFATSALYLPPGRMTAPAKPVPANASVEELLGAARAA